jgi:hypothetical protein
MKNSHQKTLEAIFRQPTPSSLEWRRIEALFLAIGAKLIEGSGSRVRFTLHGVVAHFIGRILRKKQNLIKFEMLKISLNK